MVWALISRASARAASSQAARAKRQTLRGTPAVARTKRSTAAGSKTFDRLIPTASSPVLR
jgi:hypothetical protein